MSGHNGDVVRPELRLTTEEGCGDFTGVTPLSLYRTWIVYTARKFNSPL